MSSQETSLLPRNKRRMVMIITLSISLLAAGRGGIAQVVTQESPSQPPSSWREMEDRVPAHLPIKIKIKNLQNEHWLRDLEIEVTNKATKPIYYFKFTVLMPDITDGGIEIGYPIRYGRHELISITTPLIPEDVPIKPGETVVLKYPESDWRGWEGYAASRNLPKSEPKKVRILFHALNFGDGTGFKYLDGTPIPIRRSISFLQEQKKGWNGRASTTELMTCFPDMSLQQAAFSLPLKAGNAKATLHGVCCPDGTASYCNFMKGIPEGYSCSCGLADWTEDVLNCDG